MDDTKKTKKDNSSFEMIVNKPTAKSKKLTAKWTVEAQQDLVSEHGGGDRNPKFKGMSVVEVEDIFRAALDKWIWETKDKAENKILFEEAEQELKDREVWNLEDELAGILAKEMTKEIDNEIIASLMKEADKMKKESDTLTMEKLTKVCKSIKVLP